MLNSTTTMAEIATAKNQSKRSIEITAIKQGWNYTEVNSRSGYKRRMFELDDLPEGIRTAVIAARLSSAINTETKASSGDIRLVIDADRRVEINLVDGKIIILVGRYVPA